MSIRTLLAAALNSFSYLIISCLILSHSNSFFIILRLILRLRASQVGNDIRQVLHAMQMWRAKSKNMRYTELKDGMQRIEKDKVNYLPITISSYPTF